MYLSIRFVFLFVLEVTCLYFSALSCKNFCDFTFGRGCSSRGKENDNTPDLRVDKTPLDLGPVCPVYPGNNLVSRPDHV